MTLLVLLLTGFSAYGDMPNMPRDEDYETELECEFLLTNPIESEDAVGWLNELIQSASGSSAVAAVAAGLPTELAYKEIGLPVVMPGELTMMLDSSMLRVTSPGGELRSYAIFPPPVAVWKKMSVRNHDLAEFDPTLLSEDKTRLMVGTVSNRPNTGTRLFISFGTARGFLTVTVGIDVNCERRFEYSRADEIQLVLPPAGHDPDHYCRVGVIKANFRI